MKAIKFYILDSKTGNSLEKMITIIAKKLDMPIQIDTSNDSHVDYLPRDYDGYLLHLSNTSEEAIQNLKEQQPESKIYGITGCGIRFKLPLLDNTYSIVGKEQTVKILEEIAEGLD